MLWNALDANASDAAAHLTKPASVAALSELLQRAMASSSDADKELRNEVLVLAAKVAQV